MKKMKIMIFVIFLACNSLFAQGVGDLTFCFDVSGSMRFPLTAMTIGDCSPTTGCSVIPSGSFGTCAGMYIMCFECIRYQKMMLAIRPTLQFLRTWYPQDLVGTDYDLFASTANIAAIHFPDKNTNNPYRIMVNRPLNGTGNPFAQVVGTYFPLDISSNLDTSQLLANGIDVDCSVHGTPLGTALQQVLDQTLKPLTIDDHAATGDNQVVILISDGEPNRSPYPDDPGFWTQMGHSDNTSYRKVYAIGIGDDDNHYEYLQILAQNTGGDFFGWWENQTGVIYGPSPSGSFDPSKAFGAGNFLWNSYIEKPLFRDFLNYRASVDPVDMIESNQTNIHSFQVTPLDSSLIVTVKWPAKPETQLDIKLRLPNESEVTSDTLSENQGYFVTRGSYYIYFLIDTELIQDNYDDWQIIVKADSLVEPIYYNYSVYSRSDLEIESNLSQMSFSTDDVLNGPLRINYPGEELTVDSVNVYVLPPETWLGNWLADPEHQLKKAELEAIRGEQWVEDISLIERKRMLLHARKGIYYNRKYVLKRRKVMLFDDGNHLDGFENDGVYNNEFYRPMKPGIYEILYTVHGKTSSGHTFRRELYFQKFVSLAVDTSASIMEFKEVAAQGNTAIAEVAMTFKDKHNNVALPENNELITIDYGHAKEISAIEDQLNGTFVQRFQYNRNLGRPKVGLTYRNTGFPAKRILFTREELIPRFDLALGLNNIFFDDAIKLDDATGISALFGGYLNRRFRMEGSIGIAEVKNQNNEAGIFLDTGASLTFDLVTATTSRLIPFLSGGGKFIKTYDLSNNEQGPALTFGGGLKFITGRQLGIEVEGTDLLTSGFFDDDVSHNLQLTVNVSFNIASTKKVNY
ncbi:MAG: hypothetical protein ACE5HO_04800 [bacterium]